MCLILQSTGKKAVEGERVRVLASAKCVLLSLGNICQHLTLRVRPEMQRSPKDAEE